jgi:L-fuconolactonase
MIDSHQHFWNYNEERDSWITPQMSRIRRDFYPLEAESIFKERDIDGCVAVQADQSEEETLFLLSLAEQNDFIKGVVGWVDLRSQNIQEKLEYYAQFEDLKGFRHIVQGEKDPFFLQNTQFIKGVKLLESFAFTYDLLIYPHQLASGIEFCQKLGDQKIVLDHLAKPPISTGNIKDWKKEFSEFKYLEHVSAKISGIVTEALWYNWQENQILEVIEHAFEVFGPKRLMFGSDYPVVLVASELDQWLEIYSKSIDKLSIFEKNLINTDNCIQFYNLDEV